MSRNNNYQQIEETISPIPSLTKDFLRTQQKDIVCGDCGGISAAKVQQLLSTLEGTTPISNITISNSRKSNSIHRKKSNQSKKKKNSARNNSQKSSLKRNIKKNNKRAKHSIKQRKLTSIRSSRNNNNKKNQSKKIKKFLSKKK